MFSLLATLTLSSVPADPVPVPASIAEVTVYGSQALVRRTAELPGSGLYVIEGLPQALDPDSVRVQSRGGDVVDVDVRRRLREGVVTPRVQALRDQLRELKRGLEVLEDRDSVLRVIGKHLESLLKQEAEVHQREVAQGRPSPEAWQASLTFVTERLQQTRQAQRELGWEIEAQQDAIRAVELDLGRLPGEQQIQVYDVSVDVVASGPGDNGPIELTLDTFVHGAGWQPVYDLRTAADLSGVELVYRARVWQQTGEDWSDVDLLLSTARPQMGAQGPEPALTWVELFDPRQPKPQLMARRALGVAGEDVFEEKALAAAPVFAQVQSEGLSVRYRLPRRETVESRNDPTTVLVGRARLGIRPERYCVPSIDPTVWLRAEARNSSEWTLLPGRAAVFFGNDFLGHAQLDTVQPGQDFTLHLGADSGLTVERSVVLDQTEGPGFLSSRGKHIERWRVHFENHGTVGARPDGSVDVILRDALPRSRDDRITVELSSADPRPSNDERWKQDRDEKSIYTWIVRVPRGGEADVVYEQTLVFPKNLEVRTRR